MDLGIIQASDFCSGYESVKEKFEENFRTGRETRWMNVISLFVNFSAQLCVYVGEEKVVDLWGSIKDKDFSGDSITNVFSSTKVESLLEIITGVMS